jgi:hypothetical protein
MARSKRSSIGAPETRPATRRHDTRHGHIVSQAPGRLRVRLHRDHRDPAELAQIERGLARRDGVDAVATNPRTGSILVHYDHHALSKADVTAMLFDVGVVAREVLGAEEVPEDLGGDVPQHSSTATGLLGALTDLDRRISRLTGGRIDVKVLVPAGLGLLALRQFATAGLGLAEVPAYVLLWYTFDSFYKLHQRHSTPAGEQASPDGSMAGQPGAGET